MKNRVLMIGVALIVSQALVLVLHQFEVTALFIVLGFRFYIPFVVAGIVALIMGSPGILPEIRNTSAKRILWSGLFLLLTGVAVYFVEIPGMWQKNDPDNLFELGLSSVFDVPLYAFWNLPQFFLLYLFLGTNKKGLHIPVNFILIIALCAADLYFQLQSVKAFPLWLAAFAAAAILLSIYWYRSGSGIEFGILSYIAIWLGSLLFGVKELLIVKAFFAKNFETWEGLLRSKSIAPELLISCVIVVSLLPVVFYRRNRSES